MEEAKEEVEVSQSDQEEEKSPKPKTKKQKISDKQAEALKKGREKRRLQNQEKHKMATGHAELQEELNKLREENTRLYKKALEDELAQLKSENEKMRGIQSAPKIEVPAPITSIEKVHPPPPPPKKTVPAFVFF